MAPLTTSRESPTEILIIGAGVLGLSTATILQSQYPQTHITLIASEFPTTSPISRSSSDSSPHATASYASMWAGAHYRPIPFIPTTHPAFNSLSQIKRDFHRQLAREKQWALATAERMKALARSNPEAGVQIVPAEEYLEDSPLENLLLRSGDVYASAEDGFRVFDAEEIERMNGQRGARDDEGGKVEWACSYETYVVNVHIYCAYLLQRFLQRGGGTMRHKITTMREAISCSQSKSAPLIVDCSGTGIPSDPKRNLIRGQTALVRNVYPRTVTRQCKDGSWSFLIPRPCGGGTIVGGTKQVGDEQGQPRPEERKALLENAAKCFPDFVDKVEDFEIVCDNVGLRPGRHGGMRIEVEHVDVGRRGRIRVIHGYGAGGRGYELSWGVAEEISSLVGVCMNESREVVEEQGRPRL